MAINRNIGEIIEPWSGSGWPLYLFVDQSQLTDKGIYICARDGCSKDKYDKECKRILREPWQLTCGHRLCKECYEGIRELPEDQRICDACKSERLDCNGSRPHNFPEMDFDEPQLKSDSSVKVPSDGGMEIDHVPMKMAEDRGSRLDAAPSRQFGKQPSLPVIVDNGVTFDPSDMKQCIIDCTSAMRDNAANRELNKMLVKCPYGCGTSSKLTVRTIEKHMSICKERLIPCERCAEIIKFSQSAVHSATVCPFRAVDCPNKCGKKGLKGNELTKHLAECEKRPPMCSICKSSYEYSEDAHSHLMKCVAKCPLNCSESSEKVNIVEHLCSEHLLGEHLLSLLIYAKYAVKSPGESSGAGMGQARINSLLDTQMRLKSKSDNIQRRLEYMNAHEERLLPCEKCAEVNRYSQIAGHTANTCPLRLVDCPYGCGMEDLKSRDLPKHLAKCQKRPQMCWICKSGSKFNEDAHDHLMRSIATCSLNCSEKHMNMCKERLVSCEKCGEIIRYSQKSEHSDNTCPFRPADCPNNCGKEGLKYRVMLKHLAECEKWPQMCWICKSSYKFNEDAHDHLMKCVTKCPLNCSEKHMKAYEERLVPCEKCAEVIRYSQKSEHAANKCPFRPVDCPNNCGKRGLRGTDLPKHSAECEKRLQMCWFKLNENAYDHLMRSIATCSPSERPSSSSFQRPQNEMNIAAGCPQFAELLHAFSTEDGFVADDAIFIKKYEARLDLNISVQEMTRCYTYPIYRETPLEEPYEVPHENDTSPEEESDDHMMMC